MAESNLVNRTELGEFRSGDAPLACDPNESYLLKPEAWGDCVASKS
jgi:hypothetical protein